MTTIKIKIEKEIEVLPQHIDDLMVTALEGGINYWCRRAKIDNVPEGVEQPIMASDLISKGGTLILFDAESSDRWVLTKEKFLSGLEQYIKEYGIIDMETLIDNHDADTADAIIQYGLFNEIVFG